jgi:hypothetical protein
MHSGAPTQRFHHMTQTSFFKVLFGPTISTPIITDTFMAVHNQSKLKEEVPGKRGAARKGIPKA